MAKHWYVGFTGKAGGYRRIAFRSDSTPTHKTHGAEYGFCCGPMSKRAALWVQQNPAANWGTIARLERMAA